MQESNKGKGLKLTGNQQHSASPGVISFLMICNDENDAKVLKDEFRKNKIANPLFIENSCSAALNLIKQKDAEENSIHKTLIVLVEINSPIAEGFEILRTIGKNKDFQNIKVFVITSSQEAKAKIEAADYYVSGYIGKPVSFDKLASAIAILNYHWHLTD